MEYNKPAFQNYDFIKQIGKGTYGTVYVCKRKVDSSAVVIKEISIDFSDASNIKMVSNEIMILAGLRHPNIIGYYESFFNDHSVFIVMEHASQGTLGGYLNSKTKSLPEMEVLKIVSQVVLGLEHIHSKGILHRDLKSENIFLSSGHKVKIGDFGISKILMDQSKAVTLIGTPYYQSPELCQNQPYDHKSDMWAFGCIIYEMCTLVKAFDATNLAALVLKIMTAKIIPIDLKKYSIALWNIIRGLLCFYPELRPNAIQLMCHPLIARFAYPLLLYEDAASDNFY